MVSEKPRNVYVYWLHIFDLRRRTGRVNYHGSAVAVIIAVIVIGMIFRLVPG